MNSENDYTSEPQQTSGVPGWARVLIFVFLYIFVAGSFQLLENFVFDKITKGNPHIDYTYKLLSEQVFAVAAIFLVIVGMMRWIDREPFVNIGFHLQNHRKDVFTGMLTGFILITVGFVILYAFGFLEIHISNAVNFPLFLCSILLFVLVAIGEEMIMRGYILRGLMLSFNKYIALMVSSLFFAGMHLMNPYFSFFTFASLFLAGIMLGASYIFTQNLWFPIGLHFGWNFMQSFVGFNVSGLDSFSLLNITPLGNPIISGGSFGFEGSVVSVFMMMICIILIFGYYKKGGGKHF